MIPRRGNLRFNPGVALPASALYGLGRAAYNYFAANYAPAASSAKRARTTRKYPVPTGLRKQIKTVMNEKKNLKNHEVADTNFASITNLGVSDKLHEIALDEQGDDLSKRISRKIIMYGVKFNGYFTSGGTRSDDVVRVLIVKANVDYDVSTDYPDVTTDMKGWRLYHNNNDNAHITVMYDRTFALNQKYDVAGADQPVSKVFNPYVKFGKGVTVEFIDDSTTTKKYRYWLIMVSTGTGATYPSYTGNAVVRFKDL